MQPSLADDPLARLSTTQIYKLKISDPQIDLSAKLFRECEAMIHHSAGRGLAIDEAVETRFSLLSVGIKQRKSIPLSALMQLHGDLSESIAPALPATIEMMLNDTRRYPFWSMVAPIAAIRRLILFAGLATFLFCLILVFGGLTSAEISQSILDVGSHQTTPAKIEQTGTPQVSPAQVEASGDEISASAAFFDSTEGNRLILTSYFLLLSGIGAAFAALYDARRYLITCTFDPRAANYTIRIMLGLIAGLLLSQLLSETYVGTLSAAGDLTGPDAAAQKAAADANLITSLSKSLLALLGGFAAQFVYKALKRLVDALESIFDPNAALEASVHAYQRQTKDQQAELSAIKDHNQQITKIGGQIANAKTDAARKQLETALISTVMQGPKAPSSGLPVSDLSLSDDEDEVARRRLDELEADIDAKAELVLLMEPEEAEQASSEIDGWRAQIRALRAKGRQLVNAENIATIVTLGGAVGLFNPIGLVVGAGSKVVGSVLGASAARRLPNLLRIMIAAGKTLDDDAYGKWKDILLGQRNANASLTITDRLVQRARALIGRIPIIGGLVRRIREAKNRAEEETIKSILQEVAGTGRAQALAKLQAEFDISSADAGDLVDLLSSHLAAETELGEAISDQLAELVKERVDEPIDALIQLARQAIGTGEDGVRVVERLLQIADLVADDDTALTDEAVETGLREAQLESPI